MIKLIEKKNLNILEQLKLEEHLLKNEKNSFCLINYGTSPAIVLGVLNKEEELVNIEEAKNDNIPLVKRFTGGGTVFVDQNTLFITFIFSKDYLKFELYPENIMKWAFLFYEKVFEGIKNFKLIENDFVIDNKKIAGNALYIKKDRFLIHTSFLFDFNIDKISKYLLVPEKAPFYRKNRTHGEFITRLNPIISKEIFLKKLKDEFEKIK